MYLDNTNQKGVFFLLSWYIATQAISQSLPIASIGSRVISVPIDLIILFIVCLKINWNKVRIPKNKYFIVICMLFIFQLLNIMVTYFLNMRNYQLIESLINLFRWAVNIPAIIIIFNINKTYSIFKSSIAILTNICLLLAIINILQYVFIGVDFDASRGATAASTNLFSDGGGNYNIIGAIFGIVILLNMSDTSKFFNLKNLAILSIIISGSLVSSSRSSILFLVPVLYYVSSYRFGFWKTFTILTITIASVVYFLYITDSIILWNFLRLISILDYFGYENLYSNYDFSSTLSRFEMWDRVISEINLNSIFFGNGLGGVRWLDGEFGYYTADNFYIETLHDAGLFGLLLYFYLFYSILFPANKGIYLTNRDLRVVQMRALLFYILLINITGHMLNAKNISALFLIFTALLFADLNSKKLDKCAL